MIVLRGVRRGERVAGFPWTLPALADFTELRFDASVTFFVGENASGKSTLLEALAGAMDAQLLSGLPFDQEPSLAPSRAFAQQLRTDERGRPHKVVLFRAEDAFAFSGRMRHEIADLRAQAAALDAEDPYNLLPGYRKGKSLIASELAQVTQAYGADPYARSHGESFLDIIRANLRPRGVYFLDEPETPFSPVTLLALIATIRAASASSQFFIATHSPMLLAIEHATIFEFSDAGIQRVAYDDVAHVRIMRGFLRDPQRYFHALDRPASDEA